MNKLINSPIKRFNIYHVYDYYDEPVLYSFINETGALFLANFVSYDEDDTETWLYLPISFKELRSIESGEISLRNHILHAQSSFVYIEEQTCTDSKFFMELTSNINPEFLPDEDTYINYQEDQLIDNDGLYNADTIIHDNRYAIDMSFSSSKNKYEMPASILSNLLAEFQRLITALSLNKSAKRLPSHSDVGLNFVGTYAGSFGVRLLSEEGSSLLNDDESKPYKEIVNLFEIANNVSNLNNDNIVRNYGWLALKHFSNLSVDLSNFDGGKIESGIPQPGAGVEKIKTTFKSKNILNFVRKLSKVAIEESERNLELCGTLTKYDSTKHRFSLISDDDKLYNGIVACSKTTFIIPAKGKAKVSIKTTENKLDGSVKEQIKLLSWIEGNEGKTSNFS